MKKRSYKITFGLKEGYNEQAKQHNLAFAEKIITRWMEGRLKLKLPLFAGLLQEGSLFFQNPKQQQITVAPTAIFYGELSTAQDMKRKHREIRDTLESLAKYLKEHLKQESVFIIYRDRNWCV